MSATTTLQSETVALESVHTMERQLKTALVSQSTYSYHLTDLRKHAHVYERRTAHVNMYLIYNSPFRILNAGKKSLYFSLSVIMKPSIILITPKFPKKVQTKVK